MPYTIRLLWRDELTVGSENAWKMCVTHESASVNQSEDGFHFALIEDELRKHVFVDRVTWAWLGGYRGFIRATVFGRYQFLARRSREVAVASADGRQAGTLLHFLIHFPSTTGTIAKNLHPSHHPKSGCHRVFWLSAYHRGLHSLSRDSRCSHDGLANSSIKLSDLLPQCSQFSDAGSQLSDAGSTVSSPASSACSQRSRSDGSQRRAALLPVCLRS